MSWERKNHGGYPTTNKDKKYAIFIGRYQPMHISHAKLIEQKLNWLPSQNLKDGLKETYRWINFNVENGKQ